MSNEVVKERIIFSKSLADLINSSPLPAFVVADVIASAYREVLKLAEMEEKEALKEIQNADTSVPNDGGAEYGGLLPDQSR